jgi:RNA polymerase sigma-70 factor, ECF subfamily
VTATTVALERVEPDGRAEHLAFGALAGEHRPVLHDQLMRATGSELVTEEVIAETFLRAWDAIVHGDRSDDLFGQWLVSISQQVLQELVDTARQHDDLSSGGPATDGEPLDGADVAVMTQHSAEAVRGALRQLSLVQREVLVHRFYEDMTVSQVARHLGRSEGAVKQLQHRAVRRLSRLLPHEVRSA